ncbi:MAG: restriction endonuclease [Nanobdellota archaeon]
MYDTILAFMRTKGPCVPMEVANHLKKDSFLASAMLSELVESGKVRMTNFTVGRSRLYFLPEHEPRLEGYLSYLNEKDQRTCRLLQEKQLLKDADQETLVRVSLRNVPDFAKALEVTFNGEKHLFWRWFLVSDVEPLLQAYFKAGADISEDPKPETATEPESTEASFTSDSSASNSSTADPPSASANTQDSDPQKPEAPESSTSESKGSEQADVSKTVEPKQPQSATPKPVREQTPSGSTQTHLVEMSDEFGTAVMSFLAKRGVTVLEHSVQRKNSDIDFDVVVSSQVGELPYYCKARKKKQVNDGDLSSAFVAGQMKKLPVLFVTTGTLTKKAQEQLKQLPITVVNMDGS